MRKSGSFSLAARSHVSHQRAKLAASKLDSQYILMTINYQRVMFCFQKEIYVSPRPSRPQLSNKIFNTTTFLFNFFISTQHFKLSRTKQSNKPPVGGLLCYVRHGLPDIQSSPPPVVTLRRAFSVVVSRRRLCVTRCRVIVSRKH